VLEFFRRELPANHFVIGEGNLVIYALHL
jgi:hypothetical protein